jgi:hypothetical protein
MSISENSLSLTGGPPRQDTAAARTGADDRELFEALSRGEYCLVLTPREIGKLARVRAAARLREAGAAVVVLNLAAFGEYPTTEQWYEALLYELGRQLGLLPDIQQFWREHYRLSPLQRWMAALREVGMEKVGVQAFRRSGVQADPSPEPERPNARTPECPPLVIFLDETEAVKSLPFSVDEFFAAIRECYNRRTQDAEFQRLTFCLLGETRLNDLIRDARTTAFNIGRRFELGEPTAAASATPPPGWRRRRKVPVLIKRAVDWISGEPYAFRTMKLAWSSSHG